MGENPIQPCLTLDDHNFQTRCKERNVYLTDSNFVGIYPRGLAEPRVKCGYANCNSDVDFDITARISSGQFRYRYDFERVFRWPSETLKAREFQSHFFCPCCKQGFDQRQICISMKQHEYANGRIEWFSLLGHLPRKEKPCYGEVRAVIRLPGYSEKRIGLFRCTTTNPTFPFQQQHGGM